MKPIYTKNRTIGLLGGSFNPAHQGHLHISLYALKKLKMDAIWWLVTPHNPLKDANELADYEQRMEHAREVAAHPDIYVSDFEQEHKLRYTHQTLDLLKRRYPGTHFIWLMGADNPPGFHRWHRWEEILGKFPIIIFDRAPFSHTAMGSRMLQKMHRFTLKDNDVISAKRAPALHFVRLRRNGVSSTALRKILGKSAVLGHNKAARTDKKR